MPPMRHLLILLCVSVFFQFARAGEPAPTTRPTIPIHAWVGIPQEQTSVERYKELAECGFTTSFSGFSSVKSALAALDSAQAAGVKLFISLPQLEKDPEGTVRLLQNHPALAGYHLRDEPSAGDFADLAPWTARIQAVDKAHPCYINLFPTYASAEQLGCPTYQEHVDRFVKLVPVPFMSFDHYPVVGNALRADWYQNLEIIRNASLAAHKPFWAFVLSVAHGPYPVPTPAHLRVQAYSDLAYGAQCIQYYTYWTPVDATWNYRDGPIDAKGNRTATYARVRDMNREIRALAPVFIGSDVLSVGHTGQLPAGTKQYEPQAPVLSLKTGGAGAVVSILSQPERRYLVIVNRDINNNLPLSIRFDAAVGVARLDKAPEVQPLRDGAFDGELSPGDICIFTWPAK